MNNQGQLPFELRKAQIENILGGNGGVPIHKSEGSRGGKIIGHTKSGKPIYAGTSKHESYNNFSKQDHEDASNLHEDRAEVRLKANKKAIGNQAKENESTAAEYKKLASEHRKQSS